VDGLLWGLVSCWQGLVSPPLALRLVRSCWEGYGLADVLRGLALVTRLNFRPEAMRKLLEEAPTAPPPAVTAPKQNPQGSGVSAL